MISFGGKNFFLDGIESHCYAPNANTIPYGLIPPASMILGNTFCLSIILYKSSAKTCQLATKSILQVK